jgi:predicted AAA+ superfamily ATPase
MMSVRAGDILLPRLDSSSRGAVAENFTAAALRQNFDRIYYWESKSQAEVDFIIQKDSQVIQIEVKSSTNTRSRSLQSYRERYHPEFAVRISRNHFGSENMIQSIPAYAVFCLTEST